MNHDRPKFKTREVLWAEYDDTLNWSDHTHNDLLVCLSAIQVALAMDIRDQNERIIASLERPSIQHASIVSLSHLSSEQWAELQTFIERIIRAAHA